MRLARLSIVALVSCLAAAACGVAEETSETSASELRALTADEILGEIIYGETLDVDVTQAPKYRAFWFRGERGDQIQAQVVAHDMTDPVLWLVDEDFSTISSNNDTRPTDLNALLNGRILPKTGKYYLVFREMNAAPRASFSVTLRNLGRLPLDCDPDGEGVALPECLDPLEYDPFSATSCSGTELSASAARARFGAAASGFRLPEARIFYRSRQCSISGSISGGAPSCSPWVRAFGLDVRFTSLVAAPPPAESTWTFTAADTTRRVKVGFSVEPTTTTELCVDGPFANLRPSGWTAFEDGTPGICGSASAKVTASCARLEPKPILIESGNPSYYTELSAVLYARY